MIRSRPRAPEAGISTLEFALLAPVVLLIGLAGVDLALFLKAQFRLEQVSAEMGEVISQCRTVNAPGDLARFAGEAQILAGNLNLTSLVGAGAFIVTAVQPAAGSSQPTVAWQYHAGSPLIGSMICPGMSQCAIGQTAHLPNAYIVPSGQVLIVTEAATRLPTYVFAQALMGGAHVVPISRYAMYLARSADPQALATLQPALPQQVACGS